METTDSSRVIFKSKALLIFSILLNLILYSLVVPVYKAGILKYPMIFIFTALTFLIPLVYARTKKIILTQQGLRIIVFWGLFNDTYKWHEITEGRYISQEDYGKFTMTNLPVASWMESLIAPRIIQLFIKDRETLVFHLNRVVNGQEFYGLLKKRVKFVR